MKKSLLLALCLVANLANAQTAIFGSDTSVPSNSGNVTTNGNGALNVNVVNPSGAATSVNVQNFPATQAVSGSVSVGNFPTSFAVSNLPATQAVSGTVSVSNLPVTGNVVQSFAYPPLSSSVTPAGYFPAGATNWSQTIPLTFKNPGGYTKFYLYASNGNAATGANGCYVRVTGSFTDYSGISTAISASAPFGTSYAFGSASNPEASIGSTVLGVGQSAIPSAVSISLLIGNNGVLNGCNLLTVAPNGSVQVAGIWVP